MDHIVKKVFNTLFINSLQQTVLPRHSSSFSSSSSFFSSLLSCHQFQACCLLQVFWAWETETCNKFQTITWNLIFHKENNQFTYYTPIQQIYFITTVIRFCILAESILKGVGKVLIYKKHVFKACFQGHF